MSIQTRSNLHDTIAFEVGDDWLIAVSCTNADGTPMDLTGAALEWKLADVDTGHIFATLTVGSGITIEAAVSGIANTCLIWLTHAVTATIAPGFYRDQLRVTTAQNLISTQMKGRIQALPVI